MAATARKTTTASKTRTRKLAVVKAREPEPVEAPPAIEYADPDEVREWADTLPDRFLHCRSMSHNWRPHQVGTHPNGGFEVTYRCVRCKCKKVQHLDTSGMPVGGTRYEHPEGYLHKPGGRIAGQGKGILRLATITRLMNEVSE